MHVPFDRRLGVHPQDADFTHHDVMDFEGLEYPLLLHVPYFQLYRKQVSSSPTSCWRCCCAATASRPRRRRATSPTTSR